MLLFVYLLWLIVGSLSYFGSTHNSVIIDVIELGSFRIVVISVDIELIALFIIIDIVLIVIKKKIFFAWCSIVC